MATKKFLIEVEEGETKCEEGPFYIYFPPMCNGAPNGLECRKINLATMKIKEYEDR